MKTQDFRSVVTNYKAVFFDAFGVLKNHKGIIPGVENTFDFLDEKGIDYYVLTNDASRSPEQLARMYQNNGIPAITTDKVISSGMLAHDWLKLKIKSGRVAYLGTEQSAHYIESAGLKTMPISKLDLNDVDDITCLAFLDDEGFDWNNDINKVINLLRKKNMSVIVANTILTIRSIGLTLPLQSVEFQTWLKKFWIGILSGLESPMPKCLCLHTKKRA